MKFYLSLLFVTLSLLAGVYAGAHYGAFAVTTTLAPFVILIPAAVTAGVYYVLDRRSRSLSFTPAYLASIVLKMLTGATLVLVVVVFDRAAAIENVVIFLISYGLFTTLEVGFLFRRINP